MTVEEWLNRASGLDDEINSLIEARNDAFSKACSCTTAPSGERIQGGKQNHIENNINRYISLSVLINQQIDRLVDTKTEILETIIKVENSILRTLLIERYINCKPWDSVSDSIHYTEYWTRSTLHQRAIKAIIPFVMPFLKKTCL